MRENKFRAWDGEQMVSPDYIDRNGVAWWKANSIRTCSKNVMQYTGLKDKNGKEIYEGDILKSSGEYKMQLNSGTKVKSPHWEVSVVLFHEGCFKRIIRSQNNSYFGDLPSDPKDIFQPHIYEEVIGNIHENQELLEDK